MLCSFDNAQPWQFFFAFFMTSSMVFWATIYKTKQTNKQTLCLKWADMNIPSVNFQEEFSLKIPALTLLTTLGYQFIPPSE